MEAFGEDGVKFDEQNAGGEYNNCATIVDGFVSENVDLMLANATYSLLAAQSATADIPILGTAITNYGIALGLVVSNGLVALAGGLLAQYQGSATIDMGRGAIVIGLAAVIIGEVLLDKVFRNFALKLLSAVIGAIIYYVVITVVLRLGLESTDLKLLTALVVAVFLAVPYWKGRYFTKPVRKEGAPHA